VLKAGEFLLINQNAYSFALLFMYPTEMPPSLLEFSPYLKQNTALSTITNINLLTLFKEIIALH
jgi:hypothetical protein